MIPSRFVLLALKNLCSINRIVIEDSLLLDLSKHALGMYLALELKNNR